MLRSAIFGASASLEARTAILVALAHSTDSLRAHLNHRTLEQYKKRLEQITRGELIGGAAMAAITAASVATTTSATHCWSE